MARAEAGSELHFHGAAGTVTGSCYLIRHGATRVLVDCGLFQGTKTIRELNYRDFPFDPSAIDAVLLTHAHIDHSGLLPKLCRMGFTGPILTSEATGDLLGVMLPDSGHIQETEVGRLNQRNRRRGRAEVVPIYTRADAEQCLERLRPQDFGAWFQVAPSVRARLWNAGHILGAASIEVELLDGAPDRPAVRMLFSGDIGPQEKSFHQEPQAPGDLDYLIVESTYGDRDRGDPTTEARREILRAKLQAGLDAGGNILIPAFAVERTQELLYDIGVLMNEGAIPQVQVFIDSPMAIRATEIFEKHKDALHEVTRPHRLFRHPGFQFMLSVEDSMKINSVTAGAIILSASGMCEAGRIRHHLKNNLWRRQATVLFVGYQAPGSLGRLLLDGEKSVRIHGEEIRVSARIRRIESYSAHADQGELVEWVADRLPVRRTVFLTHGEGGALATFRTHLLDAGCAESHIAVPMLDDSIDLKAGRPIAGEVTRRPASGAEQRDWHNEYAAFLLELGQDLQTLPDDDARRALLERLHEAIGKPKRG